MPELSTPTADADALAGAQGSTRLTSLSTAGVRVFFPFLTFSCQGEKSCCSQGPPKSVQNPSARFVPHVAPNSFLSPEPEHPCLLKYSHQTPCSPSPAPCITAAWHRKLSSTYLSVCNVNCHLLLNMLLSLRMYHKAKIYVYLTLLSLNIEVHSSQQLSCLTGTREAE